MTMNRLKALREDRDLTQIVVAEKLGVSQNTLSQYENGARQLPTELIGPICAYFGVTADYLLGLSASPAPVVSEADTALLQAYAAAPPEIREIVDTALRPYVKKDAAAS